jgi:hypothetical protein
MVARNRAKNVSLFDFGRERGVICKRVEGASYLRNTDSSLELRQVGNWAAQKERSE